MWFLIPVAVGIAVFASFIGDIAKDVRDARNDEFQSEGLSKWVRLIPVYWIYALSKRRDPKVFYFWLLSCILCAACIIVAVCDFQNVIDLNALLNWKADVDTWVVAAVLATVIGVSGALIVYRVCDCMSIMDCYSHAIISLFVVVIPVFAIGCEIAIPGFISRVISSLW